jgi:hydrogenase expression/formation protein HypC
MCIGIPMQVEYSVPGHAWCRAMGTERCVDTLLVGDQPAGSWLLVFLDTAREVIDEARAVQIRQALEAVAAAESGEPFDHLFPDLVQREPQLPDFLRPAPEGPGADQN